MAEMGERLWLLVGRLTPNPPDLPQGASTPSVHSAKGCCLSNGGAAGPRWLRTGVKECGCVLSAGRAVVLERGLWDGLGFGSGSGSGLQVEKVGTRGRTRARVLLFFQSGAAVFKTRCGQGMKLKHVPAVCAVKMTYCTRSSVIFNLGCRAKPSTACSV